MAVKDCDDIVEGTTATETEETVEQQKKPRPKRTRQVQAQVSLGKTIEIVERGIYDGVTTEEEKGSEYYTVVNILDTFGNGYIRANRVGQIADPLRAELRTFFAKDENGQMSYLNSSLAKHLALLHSTETYGVSPIRIIALEDPQEIPGDRDWETGSEFCS